ncbi:MAG: glycosyltransferase [Candidatus Moranbacteria bacterium]|nr:glycosyltransferase [Candidatus Moranbacteria bacterium]MDD5651893.1 glycosyltransferase [Candidatus Moranbacteria bacterium]MDX9855354.1 glycosyltransferase [Candidatus Moranbacteria bacterium]
MKLILIKFGKAIMTIRKNGIIKGGKRVWEYLFIFIKSFFGAREGEILFITGGVGDSAHYRSYNVAEELELHGFRCSVMIQDNPLIYRYAKKFSIFVFQKTVATPTLEKLIKKIKEEKKEIIFETDDLIFDEKYLHQMDYWKQMDRFTKKQYVGGQGSEILNDPYVRICTTTTNFLKNKLEEMKKRVFLVPNKICNKELEIANNIYETRNKSARKRGCVSIGYFSGTISHNKDFAEITDVLLDLLDKYSNLRLVLAGPLDIENKLNRFKERIDKLPMVSRAKHYVNVSSVDINVVPLEIDSDFCQAKSELKFFEAGILGVPTVATATQTFKEAIDEGVDGFLASNSEEWKEKLEKLITDADFRGKMGEKARRKASEKYTNRNSENEEYYSYLRSKIVR